MLKNEDIHTKYSLSSSSELYKLCFGDCISRYICRFFIKPRQLFHIFLTKYKKMSDCSRVLHKIWKFKLFMGLAIISLNSRRQRLCLSCQCEITTSPILAPKQQLFIKESMTRLSCCQQLRKWKACFALIGVSSLVSQAIKGIVIVIWPCCHTWWKNWTKVSAFKISSELSIVSFLFLCTTFIIKVSQESSWQERWGSFLGVFLQLTRWWVKVTKSDKKCWVSHSRAWQIIEKIPMVWDWNVDFPIMTITIGNLHLTFSFCITLQSHYLFWQRNETENGAKPHITCLGLHLSEIYLSTPRISKSPKKTLYYKDYCRYFSVMMIMKSLKNICTTLCVSIRLWIAFSSKNITV